jgi:methionyl-tRNA formyltransferase
MRLGHIKRLVLIGGGELMVETGKVLQRFGYEICAVLAPRHVNARLPLSGETNLEALNSASIPAHIATDINEEKVLSGIISGGLASLALCFGPAWIFGPRVRDHFSGQMLNFNGIPVPRYLGGAHYTWQILNGDVSSGRVLQLINDEIDRGPVIRAEKSSLNKNVRLPIDYYRENLVLGKAFIEKFVCDMHDNKEFKLEKFESYEKDRVYFPRLLTLEHAWIDWKWSGEDIERFCCAFDNPYPGASTFLEGTRVLLAGVRMDRSDEKFHPYCNGLILRLYRGIAYIGTTTGILAVDSIKSEDGKNMMSRLREGRRLATPGDNLERSAMIIPKVTSTTTTIEE